MVSCQAVVFILEFILYIYQFKSFNFSSCPPFHFTSVPYWYVLNVHLLTSYYILNCICFSWKFHYSFDNVTFIKIQYKICDILCKKKNYYVHWLNSQIVCKYSGVCLISQVTDRICPDKIGDRKGKATQIVMYDHCD